MSALYEKIIRPVLFSQDAEKMHEYAQFLLRLSGSVPPIRALMRLGCRTGNVNPVELFGLKFPNMVGLAAGFDKNAECVRALMALGFGHVEVGTVTHQKQPGNPRPRMFRYPKHEALVNSLGFNNEGAANMARKLERLPKPSMRAVPIGINIGKSRAVDIEDAIDDYLGSFTILADYADYFTVNVSSPNTPELRKLQGQEHLDALLSALVTANNDRAKKLSVKNIPILLKIAPDLSYQEIDDIISVIENHKLDGVIATNTTIQRPNLGSVVSESGGLSGRPLHTLSTRVIRYISLTTNGKLPIIGVGGIFEPDDAGRMVDAGASLVQIYSGMVYKGPLLGRDIARALAWNHRDWV